jgi:hypothetical protein
MAADLLTIIRAEIDSRLRDLEPAVQEYEELIALRDALVETGSAPAGSEQVPPFGAPSARAAAARRSVRPSARRPVRPSARRPAHSPARPRANRRRSARIDAGGQAVLAALDHGSHTIAELVVVTALPAPELRTSLRQLLAHALIVKADRAGKTAYALATRD